MTLKKKLETWICHEHDPAVPDEVLLFYVVDSKLKREVKVSISVDDARVILDALDGRLAEDLREAIESAIGTLQCAL